MKTLYTRFADFLRNEDGPTAVEYAIMVALVAVGIITAVTALGGGISGTFNDVNSSLPSGTDTDNTQ